jgi:mRNA interferase RelE/StbE
MNGRKRPSRSKSFARSSSFRIEFNAIAARQMLALDPVIRDRIARFLSTGVARNPQRIGKRLEGRLKGFWRYKIGTYRIICLLKKSGLPS